MNYSEAIPEDYAEIYALLETEPNVVKPTDDEKPRWFVARHSSDWRSGSVLAACGALVLLSNYYAIKALVVAEQHRGKGIASFLIRLMLECEVEKGRRVIAVTHLWRILERNGWRRTARNIQKELENTYVAELPNFNDLAEVEICR